MALFTDRIRQLEEEGSRLRKEISSLIDQTNSPPSEETNADSILSDHAPFHSGAGRTGFGAPYSHPLSLNTYSGHNGAPLFSTSGLPTSADVEQILSEQRRKIEVQSEIARQLEDYFSTYRGGAKPDFMATRPDLSAMGSASSPSMFAAPLSGGGLLRGGPSASGSQPMPQFILEKELRGANERCAVLTSRIHEMAERHDAERRTLRVIIDELKAKLSAVEQNRDELLETRRKEVAQQDAVVARLQETLRTVSDASRAHENNLADTSRRLEEALQTGVLHDALVRELRRIALSINRQRSGRRDASPSRIGLHDDLERSTMTDPTAAASALLSFIDRTFVELSEELVAKEHTLAASRSAQEREGGQVRERIAALQSQLDAARSRDSDVARVGAENASLLERVRQLERDLEASEYARSEVERHVRDAQNEFESLNDELHAVRSSEAALADRVAALEHDAEAERAALQAERERAAAARRDLDAERDAFAQERQRADAEAQRAIAEAQRSAAEATERARVSASRAKQARADAESMRSEMNCAQALAVELQTRVEVLRDEADSARQSSAAAQADLLVRVSEVDALRRERDSLTSDLTVRQAELQDTQLRLEQAQIEISFLRSLEIDLRSRKPDPITVTVPVPAPDPNPSRAELSDLVATQARELLDLRARTDTLEQQLAIRERRVRDIEDELERAIAHAHESMHTIETLRTDLDRTNKEKQRLEETLEHETAERDRREWRLAERLRQAEALAAPPGTPTAPRAQRKPKSTAGSPKSDKAASRLAEYRALIDQLRNKNALLADELHVAVKDRARLQADVERLEAALRRAHDDGTALRVRQATADERTDALRAQLVSSNSELQRAAARIGELQAHVRQLETANTALATKHESDMRQLGRLATLSSTPTPVTPLRGAGKLTDTDSPLNRPANELGADQSTRSATGPQLDNLLVDLRSFVQSYEDAKATVLPHERTATSNKTPVSALRHAGSLSTLHPPQPVSTEPPRASDAQESQTQPTRERSSSALNLASLADQERSTNGNVKTDVSNSGTKLRVNKNGHSAKFADNPVSNTLSPFSAASRSRSPVSDLLLSPAPAASRASIKPPSLGRSHSKRSDS